MTTRPRALQLSRLAPALAFGLCLLAPAVSRAATTLGAGDVAIIGYNANPLEDFSFVALVPLEAGTVISVREGGGTSTNYTVAGGGLAAGSVVVTIGPDLGYSSSGDSLTAFQGSSNLFFSVNQTTYTPPAGLSLANKTVVAHPNGIDAGRYVGTRTGTRAQLLTAIADTNNWSYQEGGVLALNTAPYNTAFTITPAGPETTWTSLVVDGNTFNRGSPRKLSAAPSLIPSIRNDGNNAAIEKTCFAAPGNTIAAKQWFSVYFTNTLPAGASVASARLRVQHQGEAGKAGTLIIHVSTNLHTTGWWNGGIADGAANSAPYAWNATEAVAEYDVSSILNTAEKVNNCEFLMLTPSVIGSGNVYFDYITLEATYLPSGEPVVNNGAGASGITQTSAALNGTLVEGSPAPTGRFYWGDAIGGTTPASWQRVENLGTIGVGPFSRAIDGLLANKTYHYRAYATNTLGEHWGQTNATFATLPPTVQFSAATARGDEAVTPVLVNVFLNATSALPATVTVTATGGNAAGGSDYQFATTNVTLPAGRVTTNVVLHILNDVVHENDETVVLTLSTPTGSTLGAESSHTYTIIDNDIAPTVAFSASSFNASESNTTAVLGVTLSALSGRQVTVSYRTTNDTAMAGSDYTTTAGMLSWAAGDTATKLISVPLLNDALPESIENFRVLLMDATNCTITGVNPVPVSIIDDDLGPPAISNGDGPLLVSSNSVTLSGDVLSDGGATTHAWLYYGPSDGGTNPVAWAALAALGPTPRGAFTRPVSGLTTNRNYYYRGFSSNIYGTSWSVASSNFLTGPPTVRFVVASTNGTESATPVVISILVTNPVRYAHAVTVGYQATAATTASVGTDYTLPGNSVTIPPGRWATNIVLNVINDLISENSESVWIGLSSQTNAYLGIPNTFFFTILDDDAPPQIRFFGEPYAASETAGTLAVHIGLSRPSGLPVTVNYATADGSALAGTDYTISTGKLTWAAGVTNSQTVAVPILNDDISKGDRAFEMRLTAPVNATFPGNGRATLSIIEDDRALPTVTNGDGATEVRGGMARLHGMVMAGQPPPQARIYWGPSDGGTTPSAWARTNLLGVQSGAFSVEITGLTRSTPYFYRSFVTNSAGTDWADGTAAFATTAASNFFVNDSSLSGDVYCTAVGNDANAGTSAAAPKATLAAILATHDLEPGDTVFIDTGSYLLASRLTIGLSDAGSPAGDVRIRGSTHANGSVLTTAYGDDAILINTPGGGYLTLEHLRINNSWAAVAAYGSPINPITAITVRHCTLTDNDPLDSTLDFRYVNAARIEHSEISDNFYTGVSISFGSGAVISSNRFFNNADRGLWVDSHSGVRVTDNQAGWNDDRGIAITTGSGGEQVENNRAFSNTLDGIYASGVLGTLSGNHSFDNGKDGLYLAQGDGYRIERNASYRNGRFGLATPGNSGLSVRNNLFHNNGSTNVFFMSPNLRLVFEHNTVYGGSGVHLPLPHSVTNRHNIIWSIGTGNPGLNVPTIPSGAGVMESDHNDLYATAGARVGNWGTNNACVTVANWKDITWKDPNSLGADPRFVDLVVDDFHLQSRAGSYHGGLWILDPTNSPCIDAGSPAAPYALETPYNGLRVNLGAYGNTPEASRTEYSGALYTISLSANPPAAGAVFISPIHALYPENVEVTIWATLTNGQYQWSGWSGSLETDQLTNTFLVTGNMNLVANFQAPANNTNGVPGWWLGAYGIPDTQEGAEDDTDLDGLLNWEEFRAGTIPTDPASVLRASGTGRTAGLRDSVRFSAVTGKWYRVQANTNLRAGAWGDWPATVGATDPSHTDPIAGTSSVMTLYMDPPPANTRLYRVRLHD